MPSTGEIVTPPAPMPRTPVTFDVPAGACDCHVHVIPDPARFPFAPERVYTPPLATADELLALQRLLHLDRVVIVHPSIYGTDNSATLDGMRRLGRARARGVAVIDERTSAAALDDMASAGMVGIRVNLETVGEVDPKASARKLQAAAELAKDRLWHLQVYTRLPVIAALAEQLRGLPVPLVIDHFGGARAELGLQQPGFDTLLALLRSGNTYVKISGCYRSSSATPDYADTAPLAQALIAANPERVVWGTDWPHPDAGRGRPRDVTPYYPIDDGNVLNQLARWAPDPAVRKKILVDNPARLYGF
jgi:predicted TIM-barrel fold metal-dependent hydrolase